MPDFKPVCAPGLVDGTQYETEHLQLRSGDTLLLYTDGVTEASDSAKNVFSEERLEAYLRNAAKLSPKELINGLVAEVQKFTGEAPQSDDIIGKVLKTSGVDTVIPVHHDLSSALEALQ
jgi:sigma-B regulation protein RsbU (phosphoserine phosphatase)